MLRLEFPDLVIERLVGTFPADDDNVYWLTIGRPGRWMSDLQIDTNAGGRTPFFLEGKREAGEQLDTEDAELACSALSDWLRRRTAEST